MRSRLLDTFEESLQQHLAALDVAVAAGDENELRRLLHLLKGSSATIGARELSEECRAAGRAAHTDAAELQTIADRALEELRVRLLDGQGASRTAA